MYEEEAYGPYPCCGGTLYENPTNHTVACDSCTARGAIEDLEDPTTTIC